MSRKIIFTLIAVLLLMSSGAWAEEKKPVFNVITIDGVITSPTAKYISKSIEDAKKIMLKV
jgi:Membrane-bound serine protease (ClpP class)